MEGEPPLEYNDDGSIRAFIYDQEGNLMVLRYADTIGNRLFVRWLRRHDRWGGVAE